MIDAVAPPVLRITGLNKHFGPNEVLHQIDLEIRRGEVHGFIGGNGSGKSTLIKILAGIEHGDGGGEILVGGVQVDPAHTSPERARVLGLRFVHQSLGVYPSLDVAENIALGMGYPVGAGGRIKWEELRARATELIRRYKIRARSTTLVGQLSPASQALVAIARALADVEPGDEDILVLDEPTASLPKREVDLLLRRLRAFAADGQTIIMVSHRLDEIIAVADRISVLRNGRIVATVETADTDQEQLAALMSGGVVAEVATTAERLENAAGKPHLVVRDLKLFPFLDKVNLTVHRNEILGIAGLAGSGRSELLLTLFGAMDRKGFPRFMQQKGAMTLGGKPFWPTTPTEAMRAGVAFVGEDRASQSIFIDWTIRRNMTLPWLGRFFRGGRLRHRAERRRVEDLMERYGVKAEGEDDEMWQLSGGNQQKVVMARWMAIDPDLYLLDEPTHGVDVSARAEIHAAIRKRVHEGAASAIVVSSDLEELADISDRVLLLHAGKIRAEVTGAEVNADRLVQLVNVFGNEA